MTNGKSQIGTAQEMTLSVAANLDEAAETHVPEYVTHLENRKEELEALFEDSHQDIYKKIVGRVEVAIEVVKRVIEKLTDAAGRAKTIEERL